MKKLVNIVVLIVLFVSLFGTQSVVKANVEIGKNEGDNGHLECEVVYKENDNGKNDRILESYKPVQAYKKPWIGAEETLEPTETPVNEEIVVGLSQIPSVFCLQNMTVVMDVLKKDGTKDLMTIDLENSEQKIITENLEGDYFDASFTDNICPSIFAAAITDGAKNPDVVELVLTGGIPTVLRSTFTPSFYESMVDVSNNGIYFTRGTHVSSVYYQPFRGAEPELTVLNAENSTYSEVPFGTESSMKIFAFEQGENIVLKRSLTQTIQEIIVDGNNPTIHVSGKVFFFRNDQLYYTYMGEIVPIDINGEEITFSSDGHTAVLILQGEAYLFFVDFQGDGFHLTELEKLTDIFEDGIVSSPDIYTPPQFLNGNG